MKNYGEVLTGFFNDRLNEHGFSGGILVAKNGQVLYEHYQGIEGNITRKKIGPQTPFHIASTSKTFTSTAIFQLVQGGRLHLDDSLQQFFPGFPYHGVTIRHLLSHSSGIPYYANFMERCGWNRSKAASNRDVLGVLQSQPPPSEFTPGSRFRYCNTNFVLLALVVEQVSGKRFADYLHEYIFIPAGMVDSYVLTTENPAANMPSWTPGGRVYGFEFLDGIYGDKNVFSTCRDLMAYDNAIRKNILLNQVWYEEAWKPYFQDKHYRSRFEYYGLGWRLKVLNDSLKIIYHNGWWHGNNSVFQRLIADTAVIIVTGNRQSNSIYLAAKAARFFKSYSMGYDNDAVTTEQDPAESTPQKSAKRPTPVKRKMAYKRIPVKKAPPKKR